MSTASPKPFLPIFFKRQRPKFWPGRAAIGTIYIFASVLLALTAQAQGPEADSLAPREAIESVRSPLKAALYSAALPGLGQAYNRKYWKVPLVYGLLAANAYALRQTDRLYQSYTDDYLDLLEGTYQGRYSQAQVESIRSDLRKQRENWAILLFGLYALGVMDAAADAFLADFDVSDGLSFQLSPPAVGRLLQGQSGPGWGFSVSWRF